MFLLDPGYLVIMLAALLLGGATQAFVRSSYRRYSQVPLATGLTGAEVARRMLDAEGLYDVRIEAIGGDLTDHYDPRARVLRLSQGVFGAKSVAAAGIASHEAGHAVQSARRYAPAAIRQALVPAASIGSQAAWVLIMLGFFMQASGLITLGAAVFGAAVLFQVVTLPVEFDASSRAIASLSTTAMIPAEQVSGARRVLTAAALTYVAATLISVMQLLYFIGLGRRR
jgi:Zn-dependent membrane protease YugP